MALLTQGRVLIAAEKDRDEPGRMEPFGLSSPSIMAKGKTKKATQSDAPGASGRRRGPNARTALIAMMCAAAALLIVWTAQPPAAQAPSVAQLQLRIIQEFPHDTDAFTQGLLWHDGALYESTGLPGRSTVRRVTLESGEVEQQQALEGRLFGEGLARVGDRLIQLTWRNRRAFVWSIDGLERLDEHEYRGEGWGLCHDGRRLIMSNGSHVLAFRHPETFQRQGSVQVRLDGRRVRRLNELECVDGAVWANVWQDDLLVRIDPESGAVTATVDASALRDRLPDSNGEGDVLNGIAYNPETEHFYLTGKLWAKIFEVEIVQPDNARND